MTNLGYNLQNRPILNVLQNNAPNISVRRLRPISKSRQTTPNQTNSDLTRPNDSGPNDTPKQTQGHRPKIQITPNYTKPHQIKPILTSTGVNKILLNEFLQNHCQITPKSHHKTSIIANNTTPNHIKPHQTHQNIPIST